VSELNAAGSALVYSTYLEGSGDGNGNGEQGLGIALDALRSAYVTGFTCSPDFPVTPGSFQNVFGEVDCEAFVSKLDATGSALVYSTYLGATVLGGTGNYYGTTEAYGIAIDSSGDAYVTGVTYSSFFPTTPGAFQTAYASAKKTSNAFISKLNAAGSALVYSTYLGGSGSSQSVGPNEYVGDNGSAIAVDAAGNAYVTGSTVSPDFPTTPDALQGSYASSPCTLVPCPEAFVSKLNAAGSALIYSTYLGGSGNGVNEGDNGYGIVVDMSGNAYVTGSTVSSNFPTTPGALQTAYASAYGLAFVSKFSFAIPFSKFEAKVELDRDRNAFDLDADFTLGSGGSIDLCTQAVTLVIGTDSITIPAGSFVRLGAGYFFRGRIDGAYLEVVIRSDERQKCYFLQATGRHVNLTGITNPVAVTLSIGDNTGTLQTNAERRREHDHSFEGLFPERGSDGW